MLRSKPAYGMGLPCYEIRLPSKKDSEKEVLYMRFTTSTDKSAIECFNFSRNSFPYVKKHGKLYKIEANQIA
mgnify:CR=1 FL=1|tara:strand:- start:239 stop:454 length:216 start_codon:yes stop_codon:yes gene_type:complete